MIDYLKDNINKQPIGEIEKHLGLSYHRILTKCNELGIEYVKELWTDEEIEILKKYAGTCHYTELIKVLPRRTVGAISAKAFELGIHTISDYAKLDNEVVEYIKNNWGKKTATEISRHLQISIGVLYRYKRNLGLPNVGQRKKWTPKVIEKLRKDAKIKTRDELAKKYKTSVNQISSLARKHNIELIDSKKIWNDELDKQLKKLIEDNLTISEISSSMQIKASTIRNRIKELNLKVDKISKSDSQKWTEEEKNKLIKYSQIYNIEEIAILLNKNEKQVYYKGKKLGLELLSNKKHLWTQEETETLISLHSKYELHIIAKVMERSEETIKEKARELNIKLKLKERQRWSPEEEQKLKNYKEEFTIKEMAYLLNRTTASIAGKLKYMGLTAKKSPKFWTEDELSELIKLSKSCEVIEISNIMHKSYESIISKLYELGIKAKIKSNRPWSEEESNCLLELLTSYSSFEVADILDRSEEAIIVKAIKLGYDIDYKHRRWTVEEETTLSDLWGYEPIEKIANKLNRTISSILNRAYILQLGSQISNNYDGLKIQEISDMFMINRNTILTSWVALGLKLQFRKRSDNSIYSFVTISNLYEFLKNNQNIWDSRVLEKNILGKEPDWLLEKRRRDQNITDKNIFGLDNLNKQQLLLAKKYILDLKEQEYLLSNRTSGNEVDPHTTKLAKKRKSSSKEKK